MAPRATVAIHCHLLAAVIIEDAALLLVGALVGALTGLLVGMLVGILVGASDGADVGALVSPAFKQHVEAKG
jgi:uncharacterized membrane protein